MKDITESNFKYDVIKQAQQIILKNLNSLDDKNRSEVFSKFQSIKYFTLTSEEKRENHKYADAFCDSEGNIYFYLNNNCDNLDIPLELIIHEMNHAICRHGFTKDYLYTNPTQVYAYGTGIDEGMTEYFTQKFLNQTGKIEHPYYGLVHLSALICNECGYEEIKKAYFCEDNSKLKDIIKEKFCLKDYYLVEKLFNQMDLLRQAYRETFENKFNMFFFILKQCYDTLCTMKLCQISKKLEKALPSESLVKRKAISTFNVKKFLMQESQFMNDSHLNYFVELINTEDKNYLLDGKIKKKGDVYSQRCFEAFIKLVLYNGKYVSSSLEKMLRGQLCYLNKNKKNLVLDMIHEIYRDYTYIIITSSYNCKDVPISELKKLLDYMSDRNGKINLSEYSNVEKIEILSMILFGGNELDYESIFNYFSKDDIIILLSSKFVSSVFGDDYKKFITSKELIKFCIKNKIEFSNDYKKEHAKIIKKAKKELNLENKLTK